MRVLICFSVFLVIYSCNGKVIPLQKNIPKDNIYASGFEIDEDDSELIISNPWKGSSAQFQYVIGKEAKEKENSRRLYLPDTLKTVVCLSTTQIAYMDALGLTDRIVAVANGKLVYNHKVRAAIRDKKIVDLGSDLDLDLETLISLEADAILAYAISEDFLTQLDKLKGLKQNVVLISEYMEEVPLGQTEWIKVYGWLFDKEEMADSVFLQIEKNYQETLKEEILDIPTVNCNTPWKNVWYVPGGSSFTAKLIQDAGGDYIWKDDSSRGSQQLDFENVLLHAKDADIWINTGNLSSLSQLVQLDEKFAAFGAYKSKQVFNPVKRMSETGGNDFYESAPLYADKVLEDLSAIFKGHYDAELYYYKRL